MYNILQATNKGYGPLEFVQSTQLGEYSSDSEDGDHLYINEHDEIVTGTHPDDSQDSNAAGNHFTRIKPRHKTQSTRFTRTKERRRGRNTSASPVRNMNDLRDFYDIDSPLQDFETGDLTPPLQGHSPDHSSSPTLGGPPSSPRLGGPYNTPQAANLDTPPCSQARASPTAGDDRQENCDNPSNRGSPVPKKSNKLDNRLENCDTSQLRTNPEDQDDGQEYCEDDGGCSSPVLGNNGSPVLGSLVLGNKCSPVLGSPIHNAHLHKKPLFTEISLGTPVRSKSSHPDTILAYDTPEEDYGLTYRERVIKKYRIKMRKKTSNVDTIQQTGS